MIAAPHRVIILTRGLAAQPASEINVIIHPMTPANNESKQAPRWRKNLIQRRVSTQVDHLRPQRWNWYALVRPSGPQPGPVDALRAAGRWSAQSALFLARRPLCCHQRELLPRLSSPSSPWHMGPATARWASWRLLPICSGRWPSSRARGWLSGQVNARGVVVWSGGGFGRLALLGLAFMPVFITEPLIAIVAIIIMDGLRSFMSNLANPGWTSMVADLVPESMRGRFFSSRNTAMGLAALVVAPLAGRMITSTNLRFDSPFAGYPGRLSVGFRIWHGQHDPLRPYS